MHVKTLFTLLSPLLLSVTSFASPIPEADSALEARETCVWTCGSVCYWASDVSEAQAKGYSLYQSGSTVNSYPHVYNNYEGFDFPVSGTYYEFPILSSYVVYTGGSPGADRVVFNTNNQLAGLITHTGASGNNFVACTEA